MMRWSITQNWTESFSFSLPLTRADTLHPAPAPQTTTHICLYFLAKMIRSWPHRRRRQYITTTDPIIVNNGNIVNSHYNHWATRLTHHTMQSGRVIRVNHSERTIHTIIILLLHADDHVYDVSFWTGGQSTDSQIDWLMNDDAMVMNRIIYYNPNVSADWHGIGTSPHPYSDRRGVNLNSRSALLFIFFDCTPAIQESFINPFSFRSPSIAMSTSFAW